MLSRKQAYARLAATFQEAADLVIGTDLTAVTLHIRQDHQIGVRAIIRDEDGNGFIDEYKLGDCGIEWIALTPTES